VCCTRMTGHLGWLKVKKAGANDLRPWARGGDRRVG
jgi:hypothetical protein